MRSALQGAVWVAGLLAVGALTPAAQAQWRFRPPVTTIAVQTTVTVPDGGSVSLGGYSSYSEGRTEYGVPVLGKVPYVSRGFRNVGYGRRVLTRRLIVSVRIIDLREEEYRQTGVRSR
jgi:general secretion pathway protein D